LQTSHLSNDTPADVHWNGGRVLGSRFFDALSMLLPQGEQFVIRATQDAAAMLGAPTAEVRGLIDDERSHQRAHRQDQRRLLLQHGPASGLLQRVETTMAMLSGEPVSSRLALAAAFEYLTVLLARRVLHPRGRWLAASSSPQARLWRWHCAEEIAHGDVLLLLARQHRLAYGRRIGCYLLASTYLLADAMTFMQAFVRNDRATRGVSRAQLLREFGSAARISLMEAPALLCGWLRYFLPLRALV
jgi:predicted metal-dependent hydrolase